MDIYNGKRDLSSLENMRQANSKIFWNRQEQYSVKFMWQKQ